MGTLADQPIPAERVHRLLLHLGSELLASGQASTEVEDELRGIGKVLGYPDLQAAAAPTGLFISLRPGAPTSLRTVQGGLRLGQATVLHRVVAELHRTGAQAIPAGERDLVGLRTAPHRYPMWAQYVGMVAVAGGICLILQPGWSNVALAALCAVPIWTALRHVAGHPRFAVLLPAVAAFGVSLATFAAYQQGFIDGPLRTLLCPLAVLLPGALLVTGVTELASGAMAAGSARLIYGIVQLLLFAAGIVGAAAVLGVGSEQLLQTQAVPLALPLALLGLLCITVGIALTESLGVNLVKWTALVLVCTFVVQFGVQRWSGSAAVGVFCASAAAALISNLVARFRPRVPRLVAFLPSFWLLVPGTVGLLGLTQVEFGTANADSALEVIRLVTAIALGLTVGTTLSPRTAR